MTVSVAIKGDALPDGTRANVVKALANGRAVRRVRVARKVSSTNSEKKCRVFIGANKFQASVESLLLRRKVFRMQIFAVRAPACDNRVLCRHSHTEPTPLTRITWLIIIAHRSSADCHTSKMQWTHNEPAIKCYGSGSTSTCCASVLLDVCALLPFTSGIIIIAKYTNQGRAIQPPPISFLLCYIYV